MPKTNKAGRECPAWCEEDHENGIPYTCNKTGPHVTSDSGHAWTWADLRGGKDAPETGVYVKSYGKDAEAGSLDFTDRESAEKAALLIENLAGFAPEAHGEIAARMREYAAAVWSEKEPEAGLCR